MSKPDWGVPPLDLKNNAPAALGECSREVHLASNWIIAIDAWDYCDESLLYEMLRRHPIPFELQPVIADIIAGKRPQQTKAAAKQKIPAAHRLVIAGLYAELKEGVIDAVLKRRTIPDYHVTADRRGVEVADLRAFYQVSAKQFKKEWADNTGVSIETLDNLYEALKSKRKNYPNI